MGFDMPGCSRKVGASNISDCSCKAGKSGKGICSGELKSACGDRSVPGIPCPPGIVSNGSCSLLTGFSCEDRDAGGTLELLGDGKLADFSNCIPHLRQ